MLNNAAKKSQQVIVVLTLVGFRRGANQKILTIVVVFVGSSFVPGFLNASLAHLHPTPVTGMIVNR